MMKFTIAESQHTFFLQEGAITFEELLSIDQLDPIMEAVQDSEKRDLWRKDQKIFSITTQRALVEIASQLVQEKPMRIGYDQLVLAGDKDYSPLLKGEVSLNEISSFQGIACGLLLPLSSESAGNGVFFQPETLINLENWIDCEADHYLIVYTTFKGLYVLNRSDPYYSEMVRLGYSSGDHLKEEINPIVFR